MQLFGAGVFVKTGAEGVYCAALPQQGLGIAIKCDDGAARAAQAIMATMIARFLPLDAAEHAALRPFRADLAQLERLRGWCNQSDAGNLMGITARGYRRSTTARSARRLPC